MRMDDLPVMSVAGACKAVAVTVGGSVAVECIQSFMGIPRDVVYGSLFGAVIGLAKSNERPKVGVPSTKLEWINGVASVLWLMFFVVANAFACAWGSELLKYTKLTDEVAKAAQIPLAGFMAFSAQWLLPALRTRITKEIEERGRKYD